ncbi:uncharacterized protein DS421_16g547880 [Arachis hypogaea]|nr:uncharacterized protein DS421_16g547880 [Arachis hypogaea]
MLCPEVYKSTCEHVQAQSPDWILHILLDYIDCCCDACCGCEIQSHPCCFNPHLVYSDSPRTIWCNLWDQPCTRIISDMDVPPKKATNGEKSCSQRKNPGVTLSCIC